VLRGSEFVVSTTNCGDEAIERLSKEKFDMVITDIRLPNLCGGLNLVQDIRVLQPSAAIVVAADRISIWDAKESIRLGAFGYVEKSSPPEFIGNIARKIFDEKGWIVRKADIDQFRDYIIPSEVKDNPALYYKNGVWARHLYEDIWEVGCDMKHWINCNGRFLLKHCEGLCALTAGEPYAKVLSCAGKTNELAAPMTGAIKEINEEANYIAVSLTPEQLGEDWMLWLARIQAPSAEGIPAADLIGGVPLQMAIPVEKTTAMNTFANVGNV
jgi:CheY-like chemotaxis protein